MFDCRLQTAEWTYLINHSLMKLDPARPKLLRVPRLGLVWSMQPSNKHSRTNKEKIIPTITCVGVISELSFFLLKSFIICIRVFKTKEGCYFLAINEKYPCYLLSVCLLSNLSMIDRSKKCNWFLESVFWVKGKLRNVLPKASRVKWTLFCDKEKDNYNSNNRLK